jgi:N-acetylmuramoyl-L-alanine amidase
MIDARRTTSRTGRAFALAMAVALSSLVTPTAARAASSRPDGALFQKAQEAQAKLMASPARQKKAGEWERVASAYATVVAKYPQSPYCDNALLATGDVYREMVKRFGKVRYRALANQAYRSIVSEYPSSSLGDEALFHVFEMASAAKDTKAVSEAAQAYLEAYPRGKSALLVRKQAPSKTLPVPPPPGLAQVYSVRFSSGATSTRVTLQLERQVPIEHQERIGSPDRLYIDLAGTRLHPNLLKTQTIPVGDVLLDRVRISQHEPKMVRVVLDFKKIKEHRVFYVQDPAPAKSVQLVIDVQGESADKPSSTIVASGGTSGADPFPTLAPGEAPTPTPTADLPLAPTVPPRVKAAPTAIVIAERSPAPTATATPTTSPSPSPTPTASKKKKDTPTPSPSPSASPSPTAAPSASPTASPTTASQEPREARAATATLTPAPPRPNRSGDISIARQLGLSARTIVIDAGHGGHDTGAIGPNGLNEKDLVLDVALRVARLLHSELGAEVLMTRDTDVFIPLPERTAIANSRNADLFLSIHANSSRNRIASGIETYYLGIDRGRDREVDLLAQRENAMSPGTMGDLLGLVKAITDSKHEESHDFAESVHEAMLANLKPHNPLVNDRRVRTAPFYVLIGANMPSILAEIAFVSNPEEERLLKTSDYKDKIARSLVAGVKAYLDTLNRGLPIQQLTSMSRKPTVGRRTRELPALDAKGRKETRR